MSSSQVPISSRLAGALLLIALVAACGHEPKRRVPAEEADRQPVARQPGKIAPGRRSAVQKTGGDIAKQAAVSAVRQIGVPYVYGGSSVRGFDCSGLVQYAYSQAGKRIPRTTAGQWQTLRPVDRDELRVGDVLFFRIEGKIAHVGLYLGDQRFVHAPSSGREVTVAGLDSDYYRRALVRGGRP